MLDPKLFALQAAILHVLIKNNPALRQEILKLATFYEGTFFVPNEDVHIAMRGAFDHILITTGD